jgi:hypothetical protein
MAKTNKIERKKEKFWKYKIFPLPLHMILKL